MVCSWSDYSFNINIMWSLVWNISRGSLWLKVSVHWVLWISGCTKWCRKLKRIWNVQWLILWEERYRLSPHTHSLCDWLRVDSPSPSSPLFCTNHADYREKEQTHTYTHTHVHGIRGRAALTPASLWSVSPGLPARAALHRTTHADTMLTSDSPQLSERDKPGETPNCAAALPLASADASFKNGMNYF